MTMIKIAQGCRTSLTLTGLREKPGRGETNRDVTNACPLRREPADCGKVSFQQPEMFRPLPALTGFFLNGGCAVAKKKPLKRLPRGRLPRGQEESLNK